ncbi:hypothetical protein M3215_05020 [Bacillus cytotoxicus]|uniref:Uncharacterized protein n=1 Tax=Bacillus cytotoxicus TaxID=580165 RepID=A0ACC6A362_9BACI|nr:hypothetical protein [Bacillus cytotoxicus]
MKKGIIVLVILYIFLTVQTISSLFGKEHYNDAVNKLKETKEVSSFQTAQDGVILLKGNITAEQPVTDETKVNKKFALLETKSYRRKKLSWKSSDTEKHIPTHLSVNGEALPTLKEKEVRLAIEPITLSSKDITTTEEYSLKKDDTQLTIHSKGYRYHGIENNTEALIFGIKKGNTLEGYKGSEIIVGKTKEEITKNMKMKTFAEKYAPFAWVVFTLILISCGVQRFRKKKK